MRINFGKTAYQEAGAKINLSLDVLGLMPDGYHELDTVMVSLPLCDQVSVTLYESNKTDVKVKVPGFSETVPHNAENTAAKAALQFFKALGLSCVIAEIVIKKSIPVGAGLGGGSADAAAVLRAVNALCGNPCTSDKLREIGFTVGADVPFCIDGGTVRAGGRGELLTPLGTFPNCCIVLAKPEFSISTAQLYSRIDNVKITIRPDTDDLCAAIEAGDLSKAAEKCINVFEQVLLPDQSETISDIKKRLLSFGALTAAMTGTGSAVFGIFDNTQAADRAHAVMSKDFRDCFCVTHKDQWFWN